MIYLSGLTQLAYSLQLSPEQLKAWSQNLGHASVLTTLGAYGHVSSERQGEILAALPQFGHMSRTFDLASEIAAKVVAEMRSNPSGVGESGPTS
jgi:hypothetical protein